MQQLAGDRREGEAGRGRLEGILEAGGTAGEYPAKCPQRERAGRMGGKAAWLARGFCSQPAGSPFFEISKSANLSSPQFSHSPARWVVGKAGLI